MRTVGITGGQDEDIWRKKRERRRNRGLEMVREIRIEKRQR